MKAKRVGNAMVVTARDLTIMAEVAEFGVMTREQIRRRLSFGSVTRVNATLLRLVRAGYLSRRFQPTLSGWRRALYYVGPAGVTLLSGQSAETVTERQRVARGSDLFLEHSILVNDVRLRFADHRHRAYRLERWLSEAALRGFGLDFLPDGFVEYSVDDRTFAAFLEVDRGTEALRRWQQKTDAYLQLAFSGRFQTLFSRRFFRVLVLAPSLGRLNNLQREVQKHTTEIFWFSRSAEFLAEGPLGMVWRRAIDTKLHCLNEG